MEQDWYDSSVICLAYIACLTSESWRILKTDWQWHISALRSANQWIVVCRCVLLGIQYSTGEGTRIRIQMIFICKFQSEKITYTNFQQMSMLRTGYVLVQRSLYTFGRKVATGPLFWRFKAVVDRFGGTQSMIKMGWLRSITRILLLLLIGDVLYRPNTWQWNHRKKCIKHIVGSIVLNLSKPCPCILCSPFLFFNRQCMGETIYHLGGLAWFPAEVLLVACIWDWKPGRSPAFRCIQCPSMASPHS